MSPISRGGETGVAVFCRPPGVVHVLHVDRLLADKVTCMAATVLGEEMLDNEVDIAFAQGTAAFKHCSREASDARGKVMS